ncbi:uncharacterized protein LY79DRAFT_574567 [Colletotrichum navitas]|uniref:Uncharacterized protein n=1 Tax=Colletotrichum navitas TaxID=681940 RepID=A0AAD8VBE3_9PEZI|nr:uncharacterized protein LY79DRAFT_574567 [Colletotrichum navitas]KAK1600199.1 hypothetical protein LY79DRAFT_574567 [Colletotrichum navitas]
MATPAAERVAAVVDEITGDGFHSVCFHRSLLLPCHVDRLGAAWLNKGSYVGCIIGIGPGAGARTVELVDVRRIRKEMQVSSTLPNARFEYTPPCCGGSRLCEAEAVVSRTVARLLRQKHLGGGAAFGLAGPLSDLQGREKRVDRWLAGRSGAQ